MHFSQTTPQFLQGSTCRWIGASVNCSYFIICSLSKTPLVQKVPNRRLFPPEKSVKFPGIFINPVLLSQSWDLCQAVDRHCWLNYIAAQHVLVATLSTAGNWCNDQEKNSTIFTKPWECLIFYFCISDISLMSDHVTPKYIMVHSCWKKQ